MILCARSTSRSREQNTKHRSRSENTPHVVYYSGRRRRVLNYRPFVLFIFFRFRSTSCMVHAYVDSRGAQRFVGFYSLECAFRTLIGWADKHRSRGSTALSIWITSQSRSSFLLRMPDENEGLRKGPILRRS